MSSWAECIEQALSDKKISSTLAELIRDADDPLAVINAEMQVAKRAKREAVIQATRIAQGWAAASNHPEGIQTGLMSLLVKDSSSKAGYANIEKRQRFFESKYHSHMADFLNRFRTKKLGLSQDREGLNNLVSVLYGEDIPGIDAGDLGELKQLAKVYTETLEMARQDFNELGGSISKNDAYLMPQNHDAATIRKYGKEEWLADIEQWADSGRMTDDFGNPLSREELSAGLDYAYDSITTNGLNKAKDFTAPMGQGKKMARKGSDKRFIYFKDAASWSAYQDKYGRGDLFQTLISNINMIAHDSATMEIGGTNPRAWFDAMMGMAEKELGDDFKGRQKEMLKGVFKTVSGQVEQGEMTNLRDFFQATRNVITASKLGKAVLSAISDEGFTAVTAKYNNISPLGVAGKKLKMMAGDTDMQLFAVKLGLGAESWTNMVSAGNRYGDIYMGGKTGRMAELVMRGSGLEPMTDAGRKAFTLEMSEQLAASFGKSFDAVQAQFGRAFKSYGVNEADWDLFSGTKTLDFKGVRYADMLQDGSEKFHQMIMSEVDFAVPTPDARVRAITTGASLGAGGAGTISGQLIRSMMNLKSFPITLMTTHLPRVIHQASLADRVSYAGAMMAATTILGAVAMQAKDLASGRELRDAGFDDPEMAAKFWAAAIVQGGGLGIMGDFFFADQNRFGGGATETLIGGPTFGMLDSTVKLTLGNAQELLSGDDTNFPVELSKFIEANSPSIWQIQTLKNAIFDQTELMLDPSIQKKMNQARRKRTKAYGQGYWWTPGEVTPEFMQ
ncbi:MAG: hypothetical protein DRI24_22895 [Deltaproteobacteria bacterium]|nr:MAG: hypothetical protein DRI24_22895 [Deltaproteobacteria bacterium]